MLFLAGTDTRFFSSNTLIDRKHFVHPQQTCGEETIQTVLDSMSVLNDGTSFLLARQLVT